MEKKYTKEDCIDLLQQKQSQLPEGTLPRRSDFSEEQVVAIKAYLGPWPRALEAAGLKEPQAQDNKEKNMQKRIRAKRERRAAGKQKKQQ